MMTRRRQNWLAFLGLAIALGISSAGEATASEAKTLDIDGLTEDVRESRAIGLIAKLEVQSRAERLIDDMAQFHQGEGDQELSSLEARFDALLTWLVSLVSPRDPELHDRLVASRDALWRTLADPSSFEHQPRNSGNLSAGNLRD